jgi:hypothetical protein
MVASDVGSEVTTLIEPLAVELTPVFVAVTLT